ncbi:MAG: CoA transferase [Actinomycetota bacterium]|nr:CoA transferase [Actinomycetota bacterium]
MRQQHSDEALGAPGGRPLAGMRILDLSTYVAGPSATMALSQLGADVIRIDPVGGSTDVSRLPVGPDGTSLYWAGLNQGKRSVEVDLRSTVGRELVGRMLAESGPGGGIVVTNAVGQQWLSWDELARYRHDLVLVRILGRPDGKPAVDYTVNCEVGLPLVTGPTDFDRPVNHVLPAWDLLTGLHAAIAILVAERRRSRTGEGQSVTVALSDVAVAAMAQLGFVADVAVNGQGRLRDGNYLYGSFGCDFATSDGHRLMVVALTQRHWRHLVELTGTGEAVTALEHSLSIDLSDEATRYRYRELLAALMAPWFEARDLATSTTELAASNVLWGPYRTVDDLVRDPASPLGVSGIVGEVVHPSAGSYPATRSVLVDEHAPPAPLLAPPTLGQHTAEVLGSLLGLDAGAVRSLRQAGTIGGTDG